MAMQFNVRRTFLELSETSCGKNLRARARSDGDFLGLEVCSSAASTATGSSSSRESSPEPQPTAALPASPATLPPRAAPIACVMMPIAFQTVMVVPMQTPTSNVSLPPGSWSAAASPSSPAPAAGSKQQRRRPGKGELRLAQCLEQLEEHDPSRVLRVTGLGRLGIDGAAELRRYFEARYGPVDEVLLANPPESRSVLAFLLAKDSSSVAAALADGELHSVSPGKDAVQLRVFERRPKKA